MSKKYLVGLIAVVLMMGAIAYNEFYKAQKEKRFEPKIVTFPFSLEEDEEGYLTEITGKSGVIRITVVNITAFGKKTKGILGWEAEEGYQFYGAYVLGKNLLHEEWWTGGAHGYVGTSFELKTNRTNIYKPKPLGDIRFGFGSPLKPEEQVDGWVYFEIREDEIPIELRHYEVINPEASWEKRELGIVYIWKIE